jgi:hypothetical protein
MTGIARTSSFLCDVNCDVKVSQNASQGMAQKLLQRVQKMNGCRMIFVLHGKGQTVQKIDLTQLAAH